MATHFASPHSTRTAQNPPGKMPALPQEDIGSVLERFHKWAGKEPEPVRELSYEEAVKRSRRHVYADDEPVAPPQPAESSVPAQQQQPSSATSKTAKPAPASNGKPARKTADAVQPGSSGSTKSAKKATRKASGKPAQKAGSTATRGGARPVAANPMSASQPTAAAYQAVCQAAAEIVPPPAQAPSFEQVLAAQIHPPASPLALRADTHPVAPLSSDAPAVHLTVRLAVEERNAVRERAHDLGITPAAYMRHCILEIDSLRAELESARLAYAHTPLPALAAESADSAAFAGGAALSLRQPVLQSAPADSPDGSWLTRLIRILLPGRTNRREFSIGA